MNEFLFSYAESAVSPANAFLTFIVSLIISVGIGYILGSIRNSVKLGIISTVIFEIFAIVLFLSVRDKVASERLNLINETMAVIVPSENECNVGGAVIGKWKEGLHLISVCPKEVGYYLETADLLEKEHDYNSAATLLEYSLDFIGGDAVPPPLCQRLIRYYKHLPGRPRLDVECNKYYDL